MKTIIFPGQGSQYKGMGKDLFKTFSKETKMASDILGYDIEDLCVNDPKRELGKTQFTQPALFFVNALGYLNRQTKDKPSFFAGHSLGEYNALMAAGAFDLETGISLVKKRGELMAAASGGAMAAVMGLDADTLKKKLQDGGYHDIDVANYNTNQQTVISGQQEAINKIVKDFDAQGIRIVPLFVSAPFHSRYMKPAVMQFADYLKNFSFSPLQVPVIANVTARPYVQGKVADMLSNQIASSVRWTDTICYLMGKGISEYEEIGGTVLTKMVTEITKNCKPIVEKEEPVTIVDKPKDSLSARLGSKAFRDDYGVKYAYVSGAMYRGIASKELVLRMAKAKMLGFVGTGGMPLNEIEKNINFIQSELKDSEVFGMNLLHNMTDPNFEMKTAELYLKYGITNIEAAAFMQMTPALVYYRVKGLKKDASGKVVCTHKVMAKVSRPEVAEAFMLPPPEKMVNKLLDEKLITAEQAALSRQIPMSHDICVEADSGGHTDGGVALVLLPSIQQLRAEIETKYTYDKSIRVGLAGGIGTPQAVACAFIMKADFVLTGSVNQCTVEAGISDIVKDLLQEINVQDTDYAPAGDMFEIGAKVQVLKKGVLFPARANKLYALYNQYNALEEIPEKTIKQLESHYFKKPINTIWEETKSFFKNNGEHSLIEKAEQNSKAKMGLVFRWYFGFSTKWALDGSVDNKVNFQVQTGPALGAFNQWVKGTSLENWRNRHADEIGIKMMEGAAELLKETCSFINN